MNKSFFLIVFTALVLFSCSKKGADNYNFNDVVAAETEQIVVPNSNVMEIELGELVKSQVGEYYISGKIAYEVDGSNYAEVDFGNGEENSFASVKVNEVTEEIELDKVSCGCPNKPEEAYDKVIVKPLVKSEDCSYVIAGTIKYYDRTTKEWVATVDFGDYTCDATATKITADSPGEVTTFDYTKY